jgi:glycosyltransferase involved in cell wall biosynthesis
MEPSIGLPVSGVLLAYNEETAGQSQVDIICRVLGATGITHEIIVVDDGSHDQTGMEAVQACVCVLCHCTKHGYGASLKTGIAATTYNTIGYLRSR